MDPKNAVEIKDVIKSFKMRMSSEEPKRRSRFGIRRRSAENVVLDNVSLTIKKGEVIGIIGRNGSGKSTLLKLISKIMKPDSGTIEVNGTIASILELGMGFHPDMTGRENIYIKGAMYGFGKKEIGERIDDIIEYSNLGDYIDNPLKSYSSGMTGRLAFAIMIHVDADIFLVDEILSVGDVSFSAKAVQHFKNVAKSGKTVLFVSHNLATIEEMCGRAIWIEGGKIRDDGSAKHICDLYKKEMIESFEITSELAEYGVLDAQYRLARMYLDGIRVGANPVIACEWMKRAAESRHIRAQLEYADMLFEGIGTEQDTVSAIFYYQAAADGGNTDARVKISLLMGGEDDERTEILRLFRELAYIGNPVDEYRYADLLLKTAWNDDDRKEALKWFLKAGSKGNLESNYQAAIMYRDGVGVPADAERSITLLKETAEAGHNLAQVVLADMLLSGIKTERNEYESFKWYLRSAESGMPRSQYQVATMYRDGIGTDVDPKMAKKWFNIFSRSTFVNYQVLMADILKNREPNNESEHIRILMKAAESYNANAMYWLGTAYRNLNPADMDSAIKWLKMAADKNVTLAHRDLGNIYFGGVGVEKDMQKAFDYYSMASANYNQDSIVSYCIAMMRKTGIDTEKNTETQTGPHIEKQA